LNSNKNIKNISFSLFLFFATGLCEIGGGYLVWLWLREDMSWILGIIGGFILLYMHNSNFSTISFPPDLCSIWWCFYHYGYSLGWIFERIIPDVFDIVGAVIAIVGVMVIFYMPRNVGGKINMVNSTIMLILITLALFLAFAAAIAEIGGGYLGWSWIRKKEKVDFRSSWWNNPVYLWNHFNTSTC
jgi:small multidrug resistance family-3 protein